MRIGVLIDRLNVGGVEKIAIEEVRALRAIGEDASLVVLRNEALSDDLEEIFGSLLADVPVVYLDDRLAKPLKKSFRFPMFSFFSWFHITYPILLPFVLKQQEFDYFIVHGTYTSLSAIGFKKRRGIHFSAFIWDPVSYIINRVYAPTKPKAIIAILAPLAKLFDRHIIKHMDTVLVGGTAHNDYIQSLYPDKPITTIYPSVAPLAKQLPKEAYVLVLTAWKRGKNPEYLFTIAKALPSVTIKLAGKWIDPGYEAEFKKQLENEGLTGQIEVLGPIDEVDLPHLYAHATVLLQTNDDRGFGMPALEAAGNGTTFIIPEGQGVCEIFENEVHGYYTKEKDTDVIVSLLETLFSHPSKAASMGESARKHVVAHRSWQSHARELVAVINKSKE